MEKEELIKGLASFIDSQDIDEFLCKKIKCPDYDKDMYDCIFCIIKYFSTPCKWLADNSVCVNDKSEYCADFVSVEHCGRCRYKEVKE